MAKLMASAAVTVMTSSLEMRKSPSPSDGASSAVIGWSLLPVIHAGHCQRQMQVIVNRQLCLQHDKTGTTSKWLQRVPMHHVAKRCQPT